MDFRQMQCFVALCEEKSITKAARRLHVVQPAVSMQIRKLEQEYGLTLFDRTITGVYPNDLALRLYPMCTDVLSKVEAVRDALNCGTGRLSGKLTVGIPPSIANYVLMPALLNFRSRNPGVKLAIHEGYSFHLIEWLTQGQLDFAVLTESDEDKRFRYQRIFTEPLRLLTSVNTPLPSEPMRGEHLTDIKLIVPSALSVLRILIQKEFDRAGITLTPAMEVDSLSTVMAMIREPGWASILPASAFRDDIDDRRLRSVILNEPTITRTLVAAFTVQKGESLAAQSFIECLKAELENVSTL